MAVTATLKIQLTADSVVIAESDDPRLWHSVFSAIQLGSSEVAEEPLNNKHLADKGDDQNGKGGTANDGSALGAFAAALGIQVAEATGACAPTTDAPFITLDHRYWEALKNNTGSRGPGSIAPVALAATLLCIWFKHAELGTPTVAQCQPVLRTINLTDKNPARSFRNANWLQPRSGSVFINPARWSQAVRVAKAYCLQKPPEGD
jgi:hypothetical protein